MRFLRSVLLPVLLCAVILAVGFLTPSVYGRISPDFKNEPEPVEIAGEDSPIYIESSEDILLPPWDAFDESSAVPIDKVQNQYEFVGDTALIEKRIRAYVEPFLNGYTVPDDVSFYPNMRIADDNFGILRNFVFEADPGHSFTLDLVLDANTALPLYLHVLPVGAKTAPEADDWAIHNSFMDAVIFWRSFARDPIYTEKVMTQYVPELAAKTGSDPDVPAFVSAFSTIHAALKGLGAEADQEYTLYQNSINTYPADSWRDTLLNLKDFSVLTYKDETMFLFADAFSNYPCVLFFDGASRRVTGFGLDAAMVYPYSYYAEPTPLPVYEEVY